MAPHVVIMGVSGSGKTTLGQLLAPATGLEYKDGDDLHPGGNIQKMAAGIPLTDEDRLPWLEDVGHWLTAQQAGGIVSCSALKRSYRDVIRSRCPKAVFLHVHGPFELLVARMSARTGHFMPDSLLKSQFATLEDLGPEEVGTVLNATEPPQDLVETALGWLNVQST